MTDCGELGAWIEVSLIPGLGGQTLRRLLSEFGLPHRILGANRSQLSRVVPEAAVARILERGGRAEVEKALAWTSHPGHAVITLADSEYPRQLLQIPDPPILLYVSGKVPLLSSPALAIVGSRNATPQGLKNAHSFARALSDTGLAIVSGMALGVDTAAHRGGLEGPGSTIAVLGTGIDIVYPRRSGSLSEEIAAKGALVSEFPLGTPPHAGNFPRRNRLISGLARGCLVVEAALDSGSLITARLATDQGREVFAIPGSIHSPLSKGCHALIKQGAKLIESAQDVLEELGLTAARVANSRESGKAHDFLDKMGFDPCDIDRLIADSGLTTDVVSAILLELELEGRVASLPGGLYQRIS